MKKLKASLWAEYEDGISYVPPKTQPNLFFKRLPADLERAALIGVNIENYRQFTAGITDKQLDEYAEAKKYTFPVELPVQYGNPSRINMRRLYFVLDKLKREKRRHFCAYFRFNLNKTNHLINVND